MIMKKDICTLLIFLFLSTGYIRAQDYWISFEGSGASTTVESVKVENITRKTELTMKGSEVLHLVAVITGIEPTGDNVKNGVRFFPNPMTDYTRMQFVLPGSGQTLIALHDLSGKTVFQSQYNLSPGVQLFRLEGIDMGIYFVTINNGKYSARGRFISNDHHKGAIRLTYENTISTEKKINESNGSKGAGIIEMQYSPNDRLIFTASGGESISTVTDVTTTDKTLKFDFQPCKDGDGNKYPVVKIGPQTWMAANLKTTKYENGDPVPLVTDNAAWSALRYQPAYCWYNNDEATYKNILGALYNHWAVSSGNLCPAGWHVPTYAEFAALEKYLNDNGFNYDNLTYGNNIGKALASTAMIFFTTIPSGPAIMWEYSSDDGCVGNPDFPIKRNASGFSALPASMRLVDGNFNILNIHTNWWSSTEESAGFARYRSLYSASESMGGGSTYKWGGFSVRCLKNN
jgi:uncharacterized protein (TIGR02145 family)